VFPVRQKRKTCAAVRSLKRKGNTTHHTTPHHTTPLHLITLCSCTPTNNPTATPHLHLLLRRCVLATQHHNITTPQHLTQL
jgi:hypothetical protein